MSFWTTITETIKGNEDFSELKSSSFRDFINGNILNKRFIRKQYGLLLMIAALFFMYINNRYYSEKQIEEKTKLKKELQDVKYESLTISAELTKLSRRTYVLNYINSRGIPLKESPKAPVVIKEPDLEKDNKTLQALEEHKAATEKIKNDTTKIEE